MEFNLLHPSLWAFLESRGIPRVRTFDTKAAAQVAVPSARDFRVRFEELRDQTSEWIEALKRSEPTLSGSDARANAEANLEILHEHFGKWSLDILVALYSLHTAGFEELRRQLRGITPRVLSGRLKALEGRNLVVRQVLDERPPRVRYRLSTDGVTLARLGEPIFLFLRLRKRDTPAP